MHWSFKLARILGIEVRVHITFFLLLAFFAFQDYGRDGAVAAVASVLYVCLVFLCVLLHEFGHALAARRYGIRTPDITLLPIGGVARLERMPENPRQELVVAIAGPLVNVAIALLLIPLAGPAVAMIGATFRGEEISPLVLRAASESLFSKLLITNCVLVVFNMIPAFPMDGGRVLRALMALRMNYARATSIAAAIGQAIAFAGGLYGLLNQQPLLVLVAVFIFFGAQSEAAVAQMKQASSGLRVQAAMVTQFQALPLHATLNEAVDLLLRTSQHDFPVLGADGAVRGILARNALIGALSKTGPQTPVAEVMQVNVPSVHFTMLFDRALKVLQSSDCPALPVLDSAGRLVGLFTPENVGELLMVRKALAKVPGTDLVRRRTDPPPLPV
jgi:stage IV sporulation protein FB